METSQALPAGAVVPSDLVELTTGGGPFLTIELNTESAIENAARTTDRRWRSLRSDLETRGVPDEVLRSVDPLIAEAHLGGDGLVVVADAGGLRHVEHGPAPGPQDRGWWEPLPRLATALRWRQASVPFVLALADRTGANLYAFTGGPDEAPAAEREIEGDEFPITKVGPGGWSQRRYQERAENTWEENAEDVANAVARLAGRVEARLVLLGGDVRATTLIRGSWPPGFELPVEVVPGERPWDGSGSMMPDAAREVLDGFVEGETRAIVERFREEAGQGDLAVEGASATMAALSALAVAVLLLNDDVDDEATAWVGAEAIPVVGGRGDLESLGVQAAVEVRRADALIRAAIGTSAGIRFVPPETPLPDGVGALLRWSGSTGS